MPTIIKKPAVSVTATGAPIAVENAPQSIIIFGQMTGDGSATPGALVELISESGEEADALFGLGSQSALAVKAARAVNKLSRLDVIAIEDSGSAIAAQKTLTTTGTATEAGTLRLIVASEFNFAIDVEIPNTTTANAAAALLEAAGDALTALGAPYTFSVSTNVVTAVSVNGGKVGNQNGIEVRGVVAGISVAVAASVAGANDPTLTGILTPANRRYQDVAWGWEDSSALRTYLDARATDATQIMDGVGFVSVSDSAANHATALGSLNSRSLVYLADKATSEASYKGPAYIEPGLSKAAMVAAIHALRLTDDAPLSGFLTTRATRDQFGGPELATLPLFNTRVPEMLVSRPGRGWTSAEIETLKEAGGSVLGENRTSSTVVFGELVSTYVTDNAGSDDPTFQNLEAVDTISQIREYFWNNNLARFGQSRLTEGSIEPGRDMVNEDVFRGVQERFFAACQDLVLAQSGEAALQFFKDNLDVEIDMVEGKVTCTMVVPIVVQLRQIVETIQIVFSQN